MFTVSKSLLLLDFVSTYHRFEYALKEAGFVSGTEAVAVDAETFAAKIANAFDSNASVELNDAVGYLTDNPPLPHPTERNNYRRPSTSLGLLLSRIRCVNNTISHGQVNKKSLRKRWRYSVVILNECMRLSEQHCPEAFQAFHGVAVETAQ